ncbi:MAG TPA: hypothetical protein DEP84_14545 [Chloroflexi bacterium]|nr:hypothetical protein [Chloroflexota bacterium]
MEPREARPVSVGPRRGGGDSRIASLRTLAQRLARRKLPLLGLLILLVVVATAIFAPNLAPYSPTKQDLIARLLPPGSHSQIGLHLLGTDALGRDILSRLIFGSRVSIVVGFSSVLVGALLGTSMGLVAGYIGGLWEDLIMRLVDLQLVFPFVVLALVVVALLGPNLTNLIIVFALTSWPIYARPVRAEVLSLKERDFVVAARAIGSSHPAILLRHILPNTLAQVIVIASFQVAQMVLLESAMSFLGFGVQPPTPTWGNMLADGRTYIPIAGWVTIFPGLAIMITAAGINFLGDGLRDILDPKAEF